MNTGLKQLQKYRKHKPAIPSMAYVMFAVLTSLFLVFSNAVPSFASAGQQKVYDNSDLFTEEETASLEEIANKYGEEGKLDIVIITEDNLGGQSRKSYLEDFYDQHGFGYDKEFGDAALILVNMDPSDRGVEIQGFGNAEYYLHNDRIEHILDTVAPMLSDGQYYDAMEEFAKQAAYYMKEEKGVNTSPSYGPEGSGKYYGEAEYNGPSNYYGEKNILFNPLVQLGASVVIGAIAVGIMAFGSGGRVTVNSRTYMDSQNSRVVASRDDYLRTVTTRVRKPSNNSGGGRSSGGGGISAGGHSHSGGGRSF